MFIFIYTNLFTILHIYVLLRFHKLIWGGVNSHEEWPSGIIAGGCDNGIIRLYNASKLAKNVDSVVAKNDRHAGSVKALSFNLFQVYFSNFIKFIYFINIKPSCFIQMVLFFSMFLT